MYQQPRTAPGGAPIPENYSGNAFRYPPIGSLGTPVPDDPELPPLEESDRHEEEGLPMSVVPIERQEKQRPIGEEGGGGLLRMLGSEEWLLLGLCLLLMGEGGPRLGGVGQKNDLLPYLLLLLFCG
jgi:hypothetical protein